MTVARKINKRSAEPELDDLKNPKVGARRGRPTKLTPTLMDEVCDMIREITPPDIACARVGITTQCLNAWRRRGNAALEVIASGAELPDEEKLFADFETAIGQALGDATRLLLRLNLGHAKKNPITAWRLLETFAPAFRQQSTVNANVKSDNKHEHGGAVRVGVEVAGALTVKGADAIRRDVLLGGKSIADVRGEYEANKKKVGA